MDAGYLELLFGVMDTLVGVMLTSMNMHTKNTCTHTPHTHTHAHAHTHTHYSLSWLN